MAVSIKTLRTNELTLAADDGHRRTRLLAVLDVTRPMIVGDIDRDKLLEVRIKMAILNRI